MTVRKTLLHRLLATSSTTSPSPSKFCNLVPSNPWSFLDKLVSKSAKPGLVRRFLHHDQDGTLSNSSTITTMPVGETSLRSINRETLGLHTISPPIPPSGNIITMEEVRKVLKVSQMEKVKNRLRDVSETSITYSHFIQICRGDVDGDKSSHEHGHAIAKDLDKSGVVLVLGDVVFLKPDEVARAVERAISFPRNGENEEELEDLERQKSVIDEIAINSVRRELWCGLGFIVVQTIGLMRLTFWELSWDVMEPICFYITSVYFMLGYAFFLRTSKDPSYEGVLNSRLAAKRKSLVEKYSFDVQRWLELRRKMGMDRNRIKDNKDCRKLMTPSSSTTSSSTTSSSDGCECRSML